eukprot:6304571-Prymnesium_polylepis.1
MDPPTATPGGKLPALSARFVASAPIAIGPVASVELAEDGASSLSRPSEMNYPRFMISPRQPPKTANDRRKLSPIRAT